MRKASEWICVDDPEKSILDSRLEAVNGFRTYHDRDCMSYFLIRYFDRLVSAWVCFFPPNVRIL